MMNEPSSPNTNIRPATTTSAKPIMYQSPASAPPPSYPTAIITEEQSCISPTTTTANNYDDDDSQQPRRRTLKDRIRRNMLASSLPPSFNYATTISNNMMASSSSYNNLSSIATTSTFSDEQQPTATRNKNERRSSVLDAASALASLGAALPSLGDGGGVNVDGMNGIDRGVTEINNNIVGGGDISDSTSGIRRDRSMTIGGSSDPNIKRRLYDLYHQAPRTVTGVSTRHYTLHDTNSNERGRMGKHQGQGRDDVVSLGGIRPPPSLDHHHHHHHRPLQPTTNTPHDMYTSSNGIGKTMGMARDVGRPYNDLGGTINDQTSSLLGGSGDNDIPLTFPQKLMNVLSNPEVSDIITWLPHGKGFIILQKRRFSMDVMPLYFKHSKFTSFTRKLNRWGFTRVSRGPEMGAYYHKFFQRGNYLLSMQMHCQSTNKSSSSTSASPKKKSSNVDGSKSATIKTKTTPKKRKKKSLVAGVKLSSPKNTIKQPPTIELLDDDDDDELMANEEEDSTKTGGSDSPLVSPHTRMLLPPIGSSSSTFLHSPRCGTVFVPQSAKKVHDGTSRFGTHDQIEHTNKSGFDRAFSRQQALLRDSNHHQGHQGSQQQDGNVTNRYQQSRLNKSSSPMEQSSSLSRMDKQRQLQLIASLQQSNALLQQQQRRHMQSNMPQHEQGGQSFNVNVVNEQPAMHTNESRSHPQAIANALQALKSSNDYAYLTALMTNEHTKADSLTLQGSEDGNTPVSLMPYQIQSRVHAAMKAQLEQYQEYNQAITPTHHASSQSPPAVSYNNSNPHQGRPSVLDYTAMLSHEKQPEKSNTSSQQGAVSSPADNGSGTMKMSSMMSQLSQSEVAQLRLIHNHLRESQQSQQSGSGTVTGGKRKYGRSVRRASAA